MTDHDSPAPPQVHLDDIAQIAVTVSDLERAKDFYQNILGMQHLFDAGPMSFFQCGKIRFAIGISDKPTSPGGTILYFRVPDIQEAYRALSAKGIEFLEKPHVVARMPDHDLWLAFLADPDKNPIGMMCEVPRAGAPVPV